MLEDIRRAVAYAAVARINGQFPSSIYSFDRGRHSFMSDGYDYESSSHVSGMRSGNLYHYGIGAHVSLSVEEAGFAGFDYNSGSHFTGSVSGGNVTLYDYGVGRYYTYSV